MAKRTNHYDVAFERMLRMIRRPYVAVDEAKRALCADASLKSMDFIVYCPERVNLLIDVKGRKFPNASRHWENWTMADDITSLMQWEQVFGDGFRSLLVFAYEINSSDEMACHDLVWDFRSRRYAFYGVWTEDYAAAMRVRSPAWQTVNLPAREFARLRRPLLELL